MFINNINPVLLTVGPFSVRYYGIVYALGFIVAYFFLRHYIKNGRLKLTESQLDSYFLWLIIGIIVGARFFEVFVYDVSYYIHHLNEIYMIWNGGMSFHGGLVGAILVTWIFAKKYKFNMYDILDLMVIPAAFSLMIGRIANYTNSELYGYPTLPEKVPWCVVFKRVDNYCRHPTQIYESLKNLLILITLSVYQYHIEMTDYKHYKKGTMFWLFVLLYGVLRFFISFWRDEPKYYGLDVGQWLCIVMVIAGAYFLWYISRKKGNAK